MSGDGTKVHRRKKKVGGEGGGGKRVGKGDEAKIDKEKMLLQMGTQ